MDRALLELFSRHRTAGLNTAAQRMMEVGTSPWILLAVGVLGVGVVVLSRQWRLGVAVLTSYAVSSVVVVVLKAMIDRPRPAGVLSLVHLDGSAMPSTHATRTAAVALAAVALLPGLSTAARRVVAIAAGAAVGLVGLCMVYLGGHWLTDVLVGWALGVAIGLVAVWASRRLVGSA
jgi:undecaprenyl-diphosphatase